MARGLIVKSLVLVALTALHLRDLSYATSTSSSSPAVVSMVEEEGTHPVSLPNKDITSTDEFDEEFLSHSTDSPSSSSSSPTIPTFHISTSPSLSSKNQLLISYCTQ